MQQPNAVFSDIEAAKRLLNAIEKENDSSRSYRIMEVCGTHTMSIARYGIHSLLPSNISLVSGPGCPVCVTSQADIDNAIDLAYVDNVEISTFGDMLKIKGSTGRSLYDAKAVLNNVNTIYSPLDTIALAKANPDKQYVFLAVGFETTTPMAAGLIHTAKQQAVKNISVFPMCKTMPKAFEFLLSEPDAHIDGFLCPGNVSVVTGLSIYEPIAEAKKAAVVAGFEPADILSSVLEIIRQINKNDFKVVNNYLRAVNPKGNKKATELTYSVFTAADAKWRGLGVLEKSGMAVNDKYADYDAVKIFNIDMNRTEPKTACRCGEILKGYIPPYECPLFGKTCTPVDAVGPCMVSSEGACAAHYKYKK